LEKIDKERNGPLPIEDHFLLQIFWHQISHPGNMSPGRGFSARHSDSGENRPKRTDFHGSQSARGQPNEKRAASKFIDAALDSCRSDSAD